MRKLIAGYYRLLDWLLAATVGILIIPVTLQIIARFTQLIPHWIWTEEMARFLFIWMVMLGAMIGVRDASHFECDVWPELKPRANALLRIVSNVFVLVFALGLACLPVLFIEPRLSPMVVFNTTFKAYNSFILLAVPFFLLTANLMNVGGITDRLVRLSRAMVGNFPGALAQINVLLSVFFAGISGSSTADAASQGKIFIQAQVDEGYDLSFSIAITAVSAVLAVIIPPSILMIVWGGVLSVSIGALCLAGVIPGLLLAGAQMATVHVYAKIRHYPTYPRATFKEFVISAFVSVPA